MSLKKVRDWIGSKKAKGQFEIVEDGHMFIDLVRRLNDNKHFARKQVIEREGDFFVLMAFCDDLINVCICKAEDMKEVVKWIQTPINSIQ